MTSLLLVTCLSLLGLSDPAEISGVVQDPDGRPIAEADVFLESPAELDPAKKLLSSVKSNAQGEFTIQSMVESPKKNPFRLLVVAKPGWSFGGQHLGIQPPAEPLQITLRKSHRITVRLLSPDGKPVPNARLAVSLVSVDDNSHAQLGSLSEKFAKTTNASGEAELDGVVKGRTVQVTATAPRFGSQSLSIAEAGDKGDVTLSPVGLVRGRVTAPNDAAVKGLRVNAVTHAQAGLSFRNGVGTATTNEQGEFEIADLMAGQGSVAVATNPESDLVAQSTNVLVKAGETANVEIKLLTAKRVIGVVRDAETKKPIADVAVGTSVGQRVETATSDKDGKFQIKMLPGMNHLNLQVVPAPYITPIYGFRQFTLAENFLDGHEPAEAVFELQRGESITGRVEGADGQPVSDARISAAFNYREGQLGTLRQSSTKSGKDGEFTLSGVARTATLLVTAQTDDAATLEPVRYAVASMSPLKLVVSADGLFHLTGRIIDSRQRGVPRAKLELHSQQRDEYGNVMSSARVQTPGLTTDADGKFKVSKKLARAAVYQLHVEADGFLKQIIEVFPPEDRSLEFALSDIVLSRLTNVSGRVVDRDGKPVPRATVSALSIASGRSYAGALPMTKAETDAEGRFQLANVNPEAKFCYAHKPGFRFHGAAIPSTQLTGDSQPGDDSRNEVEFRLVPSDEPPLERMQPVTDRFPDAKRRELLLTLRLQIETLPATPEFGYHRQELATQAVGVDADLVETHLQKTTAPGLLVPLLVKLNRLDDAAEVAQQEPQAYQRLFLLRTVYDAVTDEAVKRDLLAQALVAARTVPNPAHRVVCQGIIAEKLLDLGDRQAAEQLVKETLPLAKELAPSDWSGYARSNFAETLCFFDLDAALAIVKEMKTDYEHDRHIGNIAHELANVRPADAERVLGLCRTGWDFDQYAVRVCYRMATVDLDRARKIAESIGSPRGMNPNDSRDAAPRPFAFAAMAHALAKSAPDRAKQLLRQAAESLPTYQHVGQIRQSHWMPAFAQRVVHWSETIDPDSTPEYLWRAIHSLDATEPIRYGSGNHERQRQQQRAGIWLGLLARYGQFPSESRDWIKPLLPKADEFAKSHAHREVASLLAAWTLLAPEEALAWHAELVSLGAEPGNNVLRIYPQPTSIVIRALCGQESDLIDFIDRHSLSLWIPDTEDL